MDVPRCARYLPLVFIRHDAPDEYSSRIGAACVGSPSFSIPCVHSRGPALRQYSHRRFVEITPYCHIMDSHSLGCNNGALATGDCKIWGVWRVREQEFIGFASSNSQSQSVDTRCRPGVQEIRNTLIICCKALEYMTLFF